MKQSFTLLKAKLVNPDLVTNLLVFLMFLLVGLQCAFAQCPTPPGNPVVYGNGNWIGYVYSGVDGNNPPQNIASTTYRGYQTQLDQFNYNLGNGSISGPNICGTYGDYFFVRYRMNRTYAPGWYVVTIGGDDGVRLSLDGGTTWAISDWGNHSYQTTTRTLYINGNTNMVLEYFEQAGDSRVSFASAYCGPASAAPTAITGVNTICSGSSTTLTANGAPLIGSAYQWGTGAVGSNIITTETGANITVSPTANTTYWVRISDPGCTAFTTAATQAVTVTPAATAPVSIGGVKTICKGSSTTLSASGGSGSVYEWGTGAVGSNVIAGATSASIVVTPNTSTSYWVRRVGTSPCPSTDAVSTTVTVLQIGGDEVTYGNNAWIGYAYATIGTMNPNTDAFSSPYRGYMTLPETFNQNWGDMPLSGPNICGSYDTRFALRFKMNKNFTAGYYTFTVGGDDGYRLSLDGGATFILNNWNEHGYTTSTSAQIYLSGSTNLVFEFYENGGLAQASFNYVSCTDFSTTPTEITGNLTVCNNSPATLTAGGGYAAANATYQWGYGALGSNIVNGQTGQTITVNMGTANRTYWVRRMDPAPCNRNTDYHTQVVSVVAPSTTPSDLTVSPTSFCSGTTVTLTASGNNHAAGASYQWGSGAVNDANVIATTAANTLEVTPLVNTAYWVRRVDNGPCTTVTGTRGLNVVVTQRSTAPVSINNAASVCSGTGGLNLTVQGGTHANGASYEWGIGSSADSGSVGNNSNSYYVNPAVTTTYWVRRRDAAPCNTITAAAFITVYPASTAPSNLNVSASPVCTGTTVTLTASGGRHGGTASYQWGTGSTTLATTSADTFTVTPTATTTYWVRRVDTAPCTTITGTAQVTVTVNQVSTAPTSINNLTTVCSPDGGLQLSATGGTHGTNAQYEWGTGTIAGSGSVGNNNSNYYVNPAVTTTYWVRRKDNSPCTTVTDAAFIIVVPASTAPNTISANTTNVCSGGVVTLSVSGGRHGGTAQYQWGSGAVNGTNVFATTAANSISVNPTVTTTYWVRRADSAPCATITATQSITIYVNQRSTPPTSITGPSTLCYTTGGGFLNAVGATPGTNAQYQWGTGAVGTNILDSTINSQYINPQVTTTYWVRLIDPAPCNNTTTAVTFTVTVSTKSQNMSGISGNTSICQGSSTTLTANGGTLGVGASYQWGTGTNHGANIISNETGPSITVSPGVTTSYWVRFVDGGACSGTTYGVNTQVTVTPVSVAPTAASNNGTGCPGANVTLTASGGSGSGSYQWGTGAVTSANVLATTSGNTLSVAPTTTTTYWVRRFDAGCGTATASASTTVTISVPGNPATFGTNEWLVYGYSNPDITLATTIYQGYYTQTTLGFDSTASWNTASSPSSATNWNGCTIGNDNFTFVAKRRGFPCGNYTLAMTNWDDAAQVYVNGTLVWSCDSYSGGNACNGTTVGTYNLTSTSTIQIRIRENGGAASGVLNMTLNNVVSTAPAGVAASANAICAGTEVILTASGGTSGTNGAFQWGTGAVGSNIITGETSASITANPVTTTTYWVRRVNSLCGQTTTPVYVTVTVNPNAVAGTLSSAQTTICGNTTPSDIVLSGQTGNVVKWQYASNAAFTVGVTDIASTSPTLTPAQMGTFGATRYFRAIVKACDQVITAPIAINVPTAVTYDNGVWSAPPTENTPVIINSNLTVSSNLTVCSCEVKNAATVTVGSNSTLTVKTSLVVNPTSSFVIEDKGSLVQIEDGAVNSGSIKMKRKSQPMKTYDYTYWSSPVQGNTLAQLSPATLSDKFYKFDPMINNWVSIAGGNATMEAGRGYIVRAPQGWSLTNASAGVYSAEFNGVPNSGVIQANIIRGTGVSNLIGNPYPSAINIDNFLTDPANSALVQGTIYLWTHNSAISSSIPGNWLYNYTADDYAKYNLTGGVRSANPAITGGQIPDGIVAAGQAFFIEAKTALSNGTYQARFNNSMRVVGRNDHFYRPAPADQNPNNGQQTSVQKNRLWLNITNTTGAYNEALIGYVTGATNSFDPLYDGKTMAAGNVLSLYSIADADTYSIQGRALPFANAEVVPMGYKTTIAGNFSFSLAQFDGLFQGQDVYLKDYLTGAVHDLKSGEYSFTSAIGTFNDRFEIRFLDETLLATDSASFDASSVLIIANEKEVAVRASSAIKQITVFDLLGRLIYQNVKVNASQFRTPALTSSDQVFIVKVQLENGAVATQKVLMN